MGRTPAATPRPPPRLFRFSLLTANCSIVSTPNPAPLPGACLAIVLNPPSSAVPQNISLRLPPLRKSSKNISARCTSKTSLSPPPAPKVSPTPGIISSVNIAPIFAPPLRRSCGVPPLRRPPSILPILSSPTSTVSAPAKTAPNAHRYLSSAISTAAAP